MAWPGKPLSIAEPPQIYYYYCYTHTRTNAHSHVHIDTHVHTDTHRVVESHLTAIRWKQISSAPVTSSGTELLLHGRYHLISSTSTYTPAQIFKNTFFPFLSLSLIHSHLLFFFSIREDKFKRSKLENQMRALGSRRDLQSCPPASQSLIHHVPQVVNSSSICKCFQILANLYAPRFIMENQL